MGSLTRAKEHLTLDQVKKKMKESKDSNQLQRWQIVYTALLQPRKAEEIATSVGVSKGLVHQVISRYNRLGIQSIKIKQGGGRYHAYLSKQEEEAFLVPFFEQAERGVHVTNKAIHQAYEQRIGKEVHKATISRLLARYNWRKVCPRSFHPKADKEAQEAFKKTSRSSSKM